MLEKIRSVLVKDGLNASGKLKGHLEMCVVSVEEDRVTAGGTKTK